MVSFEAAVAAFIAGIGVGIFVHRIIMAFALAKAPDHICSYCEWMGRRKKDKEK